MSLVPFPPKQPRSIVWAVRLMWTGAAITLLSDLADLTRLDDLEARFRDQFARSGVEFDQAMLDVVHVVVLVTSVMGSLITIGLWSWMALKNGQGRGWARVLATVFGIIGLSSVILGIAMSVVSSGSTGIVAEGAGFTLIKLLLSIVMTLLAAIILILLWRKESSEFYAASAAARLPALP